LQNDEQDGDPRRLSIILQVFSGYFKFDSAKESLVNYKNRRVSKHLPSLAQFNWKRGEARKKARPFI